MRIAATVGAVAVALASPVAAGPFDGMISKLPEPIEATSANQKYRLKVLPHNPYRKTRAQAIRYTIKNGVEQMDWMVPLSNPKRPEEIRVSNEGHLITLGNYQASGEGPDAIQIISPEGLLLKRYAIDQLMSRKEHYERFRKPWFPPDWRKDSSDFFSTDGKEWVLRTYWGQVYRFSLDSGLFNASHQGRYYVRCGQGGQEELYTVHYKDGKPLFTACDRIVLSAGDVFSLQISAKNLGGLALVEPQQEILKSLRSDYNAAADERSDLLLACKRGTGQIRIENPDAGVRLSVRVDVQ